jgi:hypothetical protein
MEGEDLWNSVQSSIQRVSLQELPKGNDYHSIRTEVRSRVEGSPFFAKKYVFQIDSRTYSVNLILPVLRKDTSLQKVDHYFEQSMKKIFVWLFVLQSYAHSKCSRILNIYIYLTDYTKWLPNKKKEPISQQHANTGFTYSCKETNEINIYREEEWFKVLLHETFHSMGMDFSEIDSVYHEHARKKILTLFSVDSDVQLHETYCEIWAETIHLLFYILFSENSVGKRENLDTMIRKFEKLWKYEQLFSLFQSVKVLHHFGITYDSIVHQTKPCLEYKEETNILSYYILKSIGVFFLNDFLEWNIEHNGESLNFTKTKENLDAYCAFFKDHYQRLEYVNNIRKMEDWFSTHSKKIEKKLEMKTMRMIVFDW